MNRIFEYIPAQEAAIVSRVLISVHKAIDDHFPDAIKASRQFTKTVFSDTAESTAADRVPGVPPPPRDRIREGSEKDRAKPKKSTTSAFEGNTSGIQPASSISHHSKSNVQSLPPRRASHFGEESDVKTIRSSPADWAMRVTIVALIVGTGFLAYVLLV